ncbi:MAG: UDP-glucose 6-dehydrogenase, partial [Thermoplasmata archaeon]
KALLRWVEEMGDDLKIVRSAVEVNEKQPLRIIDLLKKHVKDLKGIKVGVLGLAFKPGTDDIRESRSIPVVKKLIDEGAEVLAYDPQAMDNFRRLFPNLRYCKSAEDVLGKCEIILILTNWDEFRGLDYSGKIVIDGRRLIEAKKTAKIYEGVCW